MMQIARSITYLAIAAIGCVGCDSIHGVSRTLPVNVLPSPEVIEQAIWATPGVTEMKRVDIPPQGASSSHDTRDNGWQFICRDTTTACAAIECRDSKDVGKQVYIYSLWMNHVPNKVELLNACALIGRICVSLHEHAPAVPNSSSTDDQFTGMQGE